MGSQVAPLDQFLLFGDSITQGAWDQSRGFGFGAELTQAYARRLDVVNRGFSGYNTDHALEVLPRVIPSPEYAAVRFMTIWFGANDGNKILSQGQYVPAGRFKKNLLKIINHPAVKAHSPHIILITPPPFEESVLKQFQKDWGYTGETRKAKDAAEYAEIVREVGKETGLSVLDVWSAFMDKAGWHAGDSDTVPGTIGLGRSAALAELLYDGLHLSPKGYKIVFDEMIKLLKAKWPEYPPYKMPFAVKVGWELELGKTFWDVNNDA